MRYKNLRSVIDGIVNEKKDNDDKRDGIINADEPDFDLDDDVDIPNDLRDSLLEHVSVTSHSHGDDNFYLLDIEGSPLFDLRFIDNGSHLRISDGGGTTDKVFVSDRRIKNLLKSYPSVTLEKGELVIISERPSTMLHSIMVLYSAMEAIGRMK